MACNSNLASLSAEERQALEALLVEFDQQWHDSRLVAQARALPAEGRFRRSALRELVKIDLERQWQHGRRFGLQAYLRAFPELGTSTTADADLIEAECEIREQFPTAADKTEDYCLPWEEGPETRMTWGPQAATKSDEVPAPAPRLQTDGTIDDTPAPHVHGAESTFETRAPTDTELASSHLAGISPDGVTVPGYVILSELGRGGMGVVYKARHLALDRIVALKMVLSGGHAGSEELTRFRREGEAVARLQHPNIVQIHEVGEHQGCPYFSLEFVEGGTLAQRLAGAPQPPRAAAQLVRALAGAIEHAHRQGIIHRDLKPANILLSGVRNQESGGRNQESGVRNQGSGGRNQGSGVGGQESGVGNSRFSLTPDSCLLTDVPKITDFGLAKKLEGQDAQTHSGAIMGTPSYMSPEQAAGRTREIGPSADIYALGAILYEMVSGKPPFRGVTVLDTLEQVRSHEPVTPSRLQATVPRDLETIVLKCLRKEPSNRYRSAQELSDELGRFLAGEPIQARPVSRWERTVKWARRRPAAAALIACVSFAIPALFLLSLGYSATAYLAEQQRTEIEQRTEAVRADGTKFLDAAQRAQEKHDLADARLQFSRALAALEREPALHDLRAHAADLNARVVFLIDQQEAEQRARERYQKFLDRRDDALFHGMLYIGVEQLPANVALTRTAAKEALELFGAASGSGALRLDGPYDKDEKEEITRGCYELLLVLGEATAHEQGDEPARKALELLARAAQLRPAGKALHLRRARYLARLGDKAGAETAREQAEKLAAKDAADHLLLGDERYRQDDLKEALEHFDEALVLRPDHFWAKYFAAVCQLRLGNPGAAKAGLTGCLFQRPKFFYSYLLRGLAYAELGQTAAAEADFQKTLDLSPNEYARYGVHINRGVLRDGEGDLDGAIADFHQAANLLPEHYEAHVNLAVVYHKQEKWAEAAGEFDKALEVAPRSKLADVYRTRARKALERGQEAAALADLEKTVKAASPARAEDHAECGRLLQRAGKNNDAMIAFASALKIDPACFAAHRGRGELLAEQKDYKEALRAFTDYLKHGPADADVFWARGQVHANLDEHAEAAEDYTRALELRPKSAHVYTDRGFAHFRCEAWRLARRDFDSAIRFDQKYAGAYIGRGYLHAKEGRYQDAVKDADQAARLEVKTTEGLFSMACIYSLAADRGDGEAEKQRCRDRSLEFLSQALNRLPPGARASFWREHGDDPDLNSIRADARFKKLAGMHSAPGK